ncbi:MAG: ferrochelatase [Thermoleophilia bacterium]
MSEYRLDVALVGEGGPSGPDDLPRFLHCLDSASLDAGAALRAATQRYPEPAAAWFQAGQFERLAAGLETRLCEETQGPVRVRAGFRCAEPSIAAGVSELDGSEVVALSLMPFASRAVVERMRSTLHAAESAEAGGRGRDVPLLDAWYADRGFATAVSRVIAEALDSRVSSEWAVLFAAQSPLEDEADKADPCLDLLQQAVAQAVPLVSPGAWSLAFLGGQNDARWLEPGLAGAARAFAGQGWRQLLVVPLGTVCEDPTTRYDMDVVLRDQAAALGLTYRRTRTVIDTPQFVAAMAEAIVHYLVLRGDGPCGDESGQRAPREEEAASAPGA